MTDLCKKNVCGGLVTVITLFGIFVTLYGIETVSSSTRISNLEKGRDDVIRVLTKLENMEGNMQYVRSRIDALTQQRTVVYKGEGNSEK